MTSPPAEPDRPVLPATASDETPSGWGDDDDSNDDRLADERPPHWEP